MKKCILFPLLLISILALAQNQKNIPVLKGVIMDAKTSELLPFVNVVIMQNGAQITGTQSDFDGNFSFQDIPTGTYSLQLSYIGYKTARLNEITIWEGQTRDLKITMTQSSMEIICCTMYCMQSYEPIDAPVDLIAEQDSINKAEDKLLPSSVFKNEGTNAKFMAYPNPTQGLMTLTNIPKTDEMLLIDANGKIIRSISVLDENSITLDLGRLQRGMYFLKYTEFGQQKTKKLMRQ